MSKRDSMRQLTASIDDALHAAAACDMDSPSAGSSRMDLDRASERRLGDLNGNGVGVAAVAIPAEGDDGDQSAAGAEVTTTLLRADPAASRCVRIADFPSGLQPTDAPLQQPQQQQQQQQHKLRESMASLSNGGQHLSSANGDHLGVKDYSVRLAPVIRQSFASYCQETTLHGWKYVTSCSSTTCEKSAWLMLLLVSLTTASVLVYRAVGDFMAHTVSTNMESLSTTFNNIYFPVRQHTVC